MVVELSKVFRVLQPCPAKSLGPAIKKVKIFFTKKIRASLVGPNLALFSQDRDKQKV
jgi:hypothetical protein